MKTKDDVRFDILLKLAKKQRLANLTFLLVTIAAMYFVQQVVDNTTDIFLSGNGKAVYWISGITLLILWVVLSLIPQDADREESVYIVRNGSFLPVSDMDSGLVRIANAYKKVCEKIQVDPLKYNLKILKKKKILNAYATGVSRGKTIGIFYEALNKCNDTELESIIAHEFGHVVNRDVAFSAITSSLGCGYSLLISIIGTAIIIANYGILNGVAFMVGTIFFTVLVGLYAPRIAPFIPSTAVFAVYLVWGTQIAVIFYFVTVIVIPLISSLVSRIKESFADAFATIHGFGPGLISLFRHFEKSSSLEIFSTHPKITTRVRNINKIMAGDDGQVPDSTERTIWNWIVILAITAGAIYLSIIQEASNATVLLFLASGCLFIVADRLMNTSSGAWHTVIKLFETKREGCLKYLLWLGMGVAVYLSGVWATYSFMTSESAGLIILLATIGFYGMIAKPVVSLLGIKSDLFSMVSDLITYHLFVLSLVFMVSILAPSLF